MTKLHDMATRAAVQAKIMGAGHTTHDAYEAVLVRMVDNLQADYRGNLKGMYPIGSSRFGMTFERWANTRAFTVLELCNRHNRTEAQMWAALDKALAG